MRDQMFVCSGHPDGAGDAAGLPRHDAGQQRQQGQPAAPSPFSGRVIG